MSAEAKFAVVTGAGTGIGRASALALADIGFAVMLAGRRIEQLNETATLAKAGQTLVPFSCDVSTPDGVNALFQETAARFGRLDVLFNNAGTGAPAVPLEDVSFEDWQRVISVNLTGSFLCAQAAMKIMRDQTPQGGRIINNGSISAHVPRPRSVAYTASKHAITGLTKSISLDGRGYNIVSGQIDIGNAATPLTERMNKGVLQSDLTTAPEPLMDVKDAAAAVAFMASMSLDSNVQFLTVAASKMKWIARG
jgi:NAD(P)-dependent dehydrogenase (short-subunit alcohol dehydrogenase family)